MTLPPPFRSPAWKLRRAFPVSPSGYYTISNGSRCSVVVYCNKDEVYSCPSMQQTLKGFSNVLPTEKYEYRSVEEKCGTASPWTRVAYLNMSDSGAVCPSEHKSLSADQLLHVGYKNPPMVCVFLLPTQ